MTHTLPDGLQLYYEVKGPEDAPETLLFLNGLSQSTAAWFGLFPLAERHRLVLVDVISQGQSDSAPNFRSFEEHAADVAHLLQALGLKRVTVVGISYGGAVAQRLLVNHSELMARGVLLSTFPYKDAFFNAIGDSWKSALHCGGYELMLDVMLPIVLGRSYFLNPLIPVEVLKTTKTTQSPTPENLLKLMRATETSGNYLAELEKVRVPVLIMHGDEDRLCTPEMGAAMHQAIKGSELKIVERVGHTLNLECIPVLAAALEEFLKK